MQTEFIIIAVALALAPPAIAAPDDPPYALSAVHADFQEQLERAIAVPGATGAAGRVAAGLMAAQSAAQERLVLPLLGWADAIAAGDMATVVDFPNRIRVEAELSQLHDGDVDLVTALVELHAAAEEAGQDEIVVMAERMIWHQTNDVEVLYPAALLISSMRGRVFAEPFAFPAMPGPLYGPGPVPMMGVDNPHLTAEGN